MALLKDVMRLIRLPNLIIVGITQGLVYFGMIEPVLARNGIVSKVGSIGFIEVVLMTLSIMICSYLINDLLDIKTDRVNKGEKQIIGNSIAIGDIKWIYGIIAVVGFLIYWHFTLTHDALEWLFIHPASLGILTFYSFTLKRKALIGNLLVAAFSAFAVGILLLFDRHNIEALAEVSPLSHHTLLFILNAFIFFAFFTSLFREVVKDIEDLEGDRLAGFQSTAVAWGIKSAKVAASIAGLILLISLLYWSFFPLNKMSLSLQFFGLLLSLYIVLLLYRLYIARVKKDYSDLSRSIKWLMAAGLMYLLLYHFLIYD